MRRPRSRPRPGARTRTSVGEGVSAGRCCRRRAAFSHGALPCPDGSTISRLQAEQAELDGFLFMASIAADVRVFQNRSLTFGALPP